MCGFIGIVGSNITINDEKFNSALNHIYHRGPDQGAIDKGNYWLLGFRRLSIIDLSINGSQPMHDLRNSISIVFNGEIYNYKELRLVLKNAGYVFKSETDTEVLLNYYKYCKGNINEVLNACNGFFSFAILDKDNKKIIFARDRLGVKPLYYYCNKENIIFGSEIKAIKPLINHKLEISNNAISAYLRLGFIPPWESAFNDINILQAGHWAEWSLDEKKIKIERYWAPEANINENHYTDREWKEILKETLIDATKIRLNADVPVGIFLSGGIDSSLIAACASKNPGTEINAHTVKFPSWSEDESKLSKLTADKLGINLKVHSADDITLNDIRDTINQFDQPFSDPSAISTSLVCKKAKLDAKVILSGDGGDEIFAGYREYPRLINYDLVNIFPDSLLKVISNFFKFSSKSKVGRILKRLSLDSKNRAYWTHIYPFDNALDNILINDLRKKNEFDPSKIESIMSLNVQKDNLRKAQIADISCYMTNNVLRKVDKISMMHSLEIRSPFLDYRIVNLGLSMPSRLKISNNTTKKILRDISIDWLPNKIVNAPKKGFGIPLEKYLLKNGRIHSEVIDQVFLLGKHDIFSKRSIKNFLDNKNTSNTHIRNLYKLYCLSIWYNKI